VESLSLPLSLPLSSKLLTLLLVLLSASFSFSLSLPASASNQNQIQIPPEKISTSTNTKSDIMKDIPLTKLTNFANSYAAAHGLQVETKPTSATTASSSSSSSSSSSYQCAPISLLPNIFPAQSFLRAKSLAPDFNLLVDRISRNGAFLNDTLAGGGKGKGKDSSYSSSSSSVIAKDAYTNKLLQLYNDIYYSPGGDDGNEINEINEINKKPNFANKADRLGIQRSDYMLNPKPLANKGSDNDSDNNNNNEYEYEPFELKQVELNTIASSFAGLATNVAKLHAAITERFEDYLNDWIVMNQKRVMGEQYLYCYRETETETDTEIEGTATATETEIETTTTLTTNLGVQQNPALDRLPFAMKLAHERYMERFIDNTNNNSNSNSNSNKSKPAAAAAVLFIVQDGETNTVDQRMLEFKLWEEHKIPVVRMSLTKAFTHLKLDKDNGSLYILDDIAEKGGKDDKDEGSGSGSGPQLGPILYQASLVYYRAGYAPTDYPDGDDGIEWKAREMIERSIATKCPSLGYHLAGTKKVQQELARPGVLERFFDTGSDSDSNDRVQRMRDAFAGLYSLGDDAVEEDYLAIKDAISGSEGRYVLKPQREGGGYNYYGEKLAAKIGANVKRNDDGSLELGEDLAEFILMQRLFPPKQRAVLLRAGMVEGSGESISELGCFGTILQSFDGETTLHNEYAGFLLRTKFENVDEGGVASGFATLSSPYLC